MKKLNEASVVFETYEREDGTVIVSATLSAPTLEANKDLGDRVEAPVSELMAAAAYKAFNDGVLHEIVRYQFGANIGDPNGA